MTKDEDLEIELPTDEDENVGDGVQKKKKEKKRKSKEERTAERKIVFWTLLVVLLVTFLFWLVPRIGIIDLGLPKIKFDVPGGNEPKQEMKNYVEYKL